MVDAWQLRTWEAYRDVARLGRKTRIGGRQRELLWAIFEQMRTGMATRNVITWSDVFGRLAEDFTEGGARHFTHAVKDEAQDVGVAELRFLVSVAAGGAADALFFAGDLGQRIFQQPFSWKSLGVDVRGRSNMLSINYRASQQIHACADRLLPAAISDVDGNSEGRRGTISVVEGPAPVVQLFADAGAVVKAVGQWITDRLKESVVPDEIAVQVRSPAELERATAAVAAAGADWTVLREDAETAPGRVAVGTMHLAKGLEFRAVLVMACDEDVLPLQDRIETVGEKPPSTIQGAPDGDMTSAGGRILRRIGWLVALGVPPVAHLVLTTKHLGEAAVILPLTGLSHAVLYTALLGAFGLSLRPGQEPIVARFARLVHGELPPDIAAYARKATIAWSLFSAGQLATSGILFAMAQREVWSLFVNVLDVPLLGLMFAAEYTWRRLTFPDRTHISILATMRAIAGRDTVISRFG